jgi:Ca2+-binding RTX toxin-like protein
MLFRTFLPGAAAFVVLLFSSGSALAQGNYCIIDGTSYLCDIFCHPTSHTCQTPSSHANCDAIGSSDGKCVICGTNGANSISGSTGNDVICGFDDADSISGSGGDDIIDAGTGNDSVMTLLGNDTVYLGNGNDSLTDWLGNNWVDGGSGSDTIHVSVDDDIIFGGTGDDEIWGAGGADQIYGGDGEDEIRTKNWYTGASCPGTDDYLGSRLCGDDDDDTIVACGWDHQCISGGGGTDSCDYDNAGDGSDPHDVATVDCETATGDAEDTRAAALVCCPE